MTSSHKSDVRPIHRHPLTSGMAALYSFTCISAAIVPAYLSKLDFRLA